MWPVVSTMVCLSVSYNREPSKAAEPIKMLFEIWTLVGSRKEPCTRWVSPTGMDNFEGGRDG